MDDNATQGYEETRKQKLWTEPFSRLGDYFYFEFLRKKIEERNAGVT